MPKFNAHLDQIEAFFSNLLTSCINAKQVKFIMSMLRLLFQVIMVSHFFACLWVLIGQYNYEYETGWIMRA